MAVTLANISADCGEVYDAVDGGTTAVSSIISVAGSLVSDITGTTTTYDVPIRFLADALVVNQVLGSVDAVSKTVGTLNLGPKQLEQMRDHFEKMANMALKIKGFTTDGQAVRIRMVNT